MIVAHGRLQDFAACYAQAEIDGEEIALDAQARKLLGAKPGDQIVAVGR